MNNLGDTSFNKRNLLKQGLGVNLYPLPFAKGGSLPKAQFGQKLSKDAQRSKARAIAKRDLNLTRSQRRLKYGDSPLENMAEAALSIVPNPAAQAARAALKLNDIRYNIQQSDQPGLQAVIEGIGMLPVFPKALGSKGEAIHKAAIAGIKPTSAVNRLNRQVLSSTLGAAARGFENVQSIADMAGGVPDEQDNPALPFFPDRRRPSVQQGVPMRFIRQERRKLLRQQSPAEKSRMGASPFAYGGSMPGYQRGGQMLDEISVTPEFNPMSTPSSEYVSPAPLDQYDTRGLGRMPRVPLGIPSSSPVVRSGVPVQPTPSAPRAQSVSFGPRTTGGGYRYGAGFFGDKGRPASGSITRRPQFKTKFHAEGGEMGESYSQEDSNIGPGRGKWGRQFQKDQRRRARMGRFNSGYGCSTYN